MFGAAVLRYAAIQFVAFALAAMAFYAGGNFNEPTAPHYELAHNFLSDLGATHAWSGRANAASAILFAIGLGTLGIALVAFAWTWRRFAFTRQRAAWSGWTSTAFGTIAGLAFLGIACTPIDLALDYHNVFVLSAFSLLPIYISFLTVTLARNGASRAFITVNLLYLVAVLAYAALIFLGPRLDTAEGFHTQVIGQKLVALVSMFHIIYLTTAIRRASRSP